MGRDSGASKGHAAARREPCSCAVPTAGLASPGAGNAAKETWVFAAALMEASTLNVAFGFHLVKRSYLTMLKFGRVILRRQANLSN